MEHLAKIVTDLLGAFVEMVMRRAPTGGRSAAQDEPDSEPGDQGE